MFKQFLILFCCVYCLSRGISHLIILYSVNRFIRVHTLTFFFFVEWNCYFMLPFCNYYFYRYFFFEIIVYLTFGYIYIYLCREYNVKMFFPLNEMHEELYKSVYAVCTYIMTVTGHIYIHSIILYGSKVLCNLQLWYRCVYMYTHRTMCLKHFQDVMQHSYWVLASFLLYST